MSSLLSEMSLQGAALVKKRCRRYPRFFFGTDNTISTAFDAKEMRDKIITTVTEDEVLLCISEYLPGGNSFSLIYTLMPQRRRSSFFRVMSKLNIKNEEASPTVITPARILACFPELVARILHSTEIAMVYSCSRLKGIHPKYPAVARHQACAGILPDTLSDAQLKKALDVLMVPYMMHSDLYEDYKKIPWVSNSRSERAKLCALYLMNAYKSNVLNTEERVKYSKAFGIIVNRDTLSSLWEDCSLKAKSWLQTNYNFTYQQ